ncbi:hypothetical protein A2U01_0087673, partial [Trifolium medium]|nr:hypothetical protein [Trifolium medium]
MMKKKLVVSTGALRRLVQKIAGWVL